MTFYSISLSGREIVPLVVDVDSIDMARNEAVRYLGIYLADNPDFADEGSWRVNVNDASGSLLIHVIVATVSTMSSSFPAPPERSLYGRKILLSTFTG